MRRLFAMLAAISMAISIDMAAAPARIGVEDLFRFLRESTAVDLSDEEVARELLHSEMTQQLTVESFQVLKNLGLGPESLAALDQLRERSAGSPLVQVPIASVDPAPDSAQLSELIRKMSDYASGYLHALPNFLCEQTTSFYKAARINPKGKTAWRLDEKVVEDLRYHDGGEDYQTRLINDKPSTAPVAEIRSNYTRGEFGSLLSGTFAKSSQTELKWDHWETVGGKRLAVIRYRIERAHSSYRVCCVVLGSVTVNGVRHRRTKDLTVGYRGYMYADPESGIIQSMTLQNFDIPTELELDDARLLLQYQPRTLNGKETWLPVKAIHFNRQGLSGTRSEIEFAKFRSFGANSVIQFPTASEPQ